LPKALQYAQMAEKTAKEKRVTTELSEVYNTMGSVLMNTKDFNRAIDCFKLSLEFRYKTDNAGIASTLNRLGWAHSDFAYSLKEENKLRSDEMFNAALQYYEQSKELRLSIDDKMGLLFTFNGLATKKKKMGDYPHAITIFLESVAYNEKFINNKMSKLQSYTGLGRLMLNSAILDQAFFYLLEANILANDLTAKHFQIEILKTLAEYHEQKEDYKNAYLHHKQYTLINNEALNIEMQNRMKYEQIRITTEKNLQLEQSYRTIKDSVNYARMIQNSLLPETSQYSSQFSDSFVLFKPCHTVSGDFYWCKKLESGFVFTVADCTGHGVPGALMSMLGISFLDDIFDQNPETTAGNALDILRTKVKQTLRQTGKENERQDGMDIVLLIFDKEMKTIQFAGANNPLYILCNNELTEYKPNKQPVGIYMKEVPFVTQTIEIEKNDCLYLFSDGFEDQIGEGKGKFKSKRMKEFLTQIHSKPMNEQREILEKTFIDWRGAEDQMDDVTISGLRI